jgi:hypothetical protein
MRLRGFAQGLADLFRGLFLFPLSKPSKDVVNAVEERYSRAGRCC